MASKLILERQPDGDYLVHDDDQPAYSAVSVWVDDDGAAWCAGCQGKIAAMSRSCRHARAVKRRVASGDGGGEP
jgi:hypothetical protein